MRLLVALLLGAQALLCWPANGEETFPYKAYVAVDDVYVRSGPGQNYYPTDKLKRGQEVEVYRHDPGGWCAVRPVEGSFAWVAGRYLKPTSAHLAAVTEDGVSARVGSRFSGIREVVQVRLKKGEVVEIVEAPPRGAGDSGWFKIAPPSGEFLGLGQVSRPERSP
jgi:SH3-like domain-containing protein